jgi:hypothetical protein
MTEPDSRYDFVYVHTDIPNGMTIHEWRARRTAERQQLHLAAREQRRQRRRRAIRRRLAAMRVAVPRTWLRSRGAHG